MFLIFIGALNIWLGIYVFKNPEKTGRRRSDDDYEMDDNDILKTQVLGVLVVSLGVILALVGLSTFF